MPKLCPVLVAICAYASAMRCPVLTDGMVVPEDTSLRLTLILPLKHQDFKVSTTPAACYSIMLRPQLYRPENPRPVALLYPSSVSRYARMSASNCSMLRPPLYHSALPLQTRSLSSQYPPT
eukprot:395679-Rhodomonas_salina.1